MANITKVYLLNVPLENDYNHTLYFASADDQHAYFSGRRVGNPFTDFSYQRKDNVMRIPASYDNLIGCNYVMYQNTAQSNKWYYAFITEMKYISEGMTELHIETDVIQTWMFDASGNAGYNIRECFIEREHVDDDTEGMHTVEEGLQLGEYICQKHSKAGYGGDDLAIVVGVTEYKNSDGKWVQATGTMYSGMYSGIKYYSFYNSVTKENGISKLNEFIQSYSDGKTEAIQCMFLAPVTMAVVKDGNAVTMTNYPDSHYVNDGSDLINTNISFVKHLDGYIPRNKKLFCYPYRYLLIGNNNGGTALYKHEDFYTKAYSDSTLKTVVTPQFKIEGCLTPGCSIRMIPKNYKGVEWNDEEGLNLGKYPILNWTSDYFTNWLTQNGVNIGVSAASSIASIIGGIGATLSAPVTGGVGGIAGASMIASGVLGVASSVGEVSKAAIVPAQSSGNLNCGDIVTASGENDFHFYDMSIKGEYAQIIDKYFDMFGYKVNRVGVPFKAHRQTHWYTKTIDIELDGAIPQNDIQKIKSCYNKGITFWRSADVLNNYSLPNGIV